MISRANLLFSTVKLLYSTCTKCVYYFDVAEFAIIRASSRYTLLCTALKSFSFTFFFLLSVLYKKNACIVMLCEKYCRFFCPFFLDARKEKLRQFAVWYFVFANRFNVPLSAWRARTRSDECVKVFLSSTWIFFLPFSVSPSYFFLLCVFSSLSFCLSLSLCFLLFFLNTSYFYISPDTFRMLLLCYVYFFCI